MHVGRTYPYELRLRTFMGEYTFPNWIRAGYTVHPVNPASQWFGPLSSEMTVDAPFDIFLNPDFASSTDEFVYNTFVQDTSAGEVYMGFLARVKPNRHELEWFTQVWVDGEPQIDESVDQTRPSFFNGFDIYSAPMVPTSTAVLWVARTGYAAVAWPP